MASPEPALGYRLLSSPLIEEDRGVGEERGKRKRRRRRKERKKWGPSS